MNRQPSVELHRAQDRFATELAWLDSHHSFSFGPHWSPNNVSFGALVVNNDDVVRAGTGFETHPHRDMEIVTWVLEGSLVHQDSEGNNGIIYPGLAQRMSAGTGILHSEKNDSWKLSGDSSHDDPVHFIQMWVLPDEPDIDPGYQQLDINDELAKQGLVVVASGMAGHRDLAAIRIKQKDAALYAARMSSSSSVMLPEAPFVHLFVARGSVDLEGSGTLGAGDAARVSNADGQAATALDDAEILVWEMRSAAG
ncbi:MAG: pirin family protein [Acidimicrobiales bacterium]